MKIVKRVRAPVRVDFAGGTTDIAEFYKKYGGAVLNCGIQKYVTGRIAKTDKSVHLEYTGKTPTSSGLGTSGVMTLVWLALISQVKLNRKGGIKCKTRQEFAERVYDLEQAMGIVGGKQDQYAGALGGVNYLKFSKSGKVKINQLKLGKNTVEDLENHLVLVYTGKPHFAGSSNKKMIDNIKKGIGVNHLIRIKEIAREMKGSLLKGDLGNFSKLMNEETENRKRLAKGVLPLRVKKIIDIGLRSGGRAAKICGSGSGGSILFYGNVDKLKRKFGKNIIDFKIDFDGLKWL